MLLKFRFVPARDLNASPIRENKWQEVALLQQSRRILDVSSSACQLLVYNGLVGPLPLILRYPSHRHSADDFARSNLYESLACVAWRPLSLPDPPLAIRMHFPAFAIHDA